MIDPIAALFVMSVAGCDASRGLTVEADPTLRIPERYEAGTLYVRPDIKRSEFVHGLVHHCQWTKGQGHLVDRAEWYRREAEAHRYELEFREWEQLQGYQSTPFVLGAPR